MKPIKLILKNFQSFQNEEYDFKDKPVLIQGKNLTEIESQQSNGSGKSTIENAIAYAYLGSSLYGKEVLDKDLVRYGEKEGVVELHTYCAQRNETLIIRRIISVKGSSQLELYKNSEENPIQVASVRDGNNYIIEWLGIVPEDLKNFFIISRDNYKSFFSSSNTDKMKLISRFSNFTFIDGTKKKIEMDISSLQEEEMGLTSELNKIIGKEEVYKEDLEEEKNRDLEQEYEDNIFSYQKKIEGYKSEIQEAEVSIEEYNQKIKNYNSDIEQVEKDIVEKEKKLISSAIDFSEEYSLIEKGIKSLTVNKDKIEINKGEINKIVKDFNKKLSDINLSLMGAVKCPKCSFEFVPGKEVDVEESKKQIPLLNKEIENNSLELSTLEVKLQEIEKNIGEFKKEKVLCEEEEEKNSLLLRRIRKGLEDLKDNKANYERSIKVCYKKIEMYQENIKTLKQSILDTEKRIKDEKREDNADKIKELEGVLKLIEKQKKEKEKEIKKVQETIFNTFQWIVRFKDFKLNLSLKQIKIIEGYINKYLMDMNSDLRVVIEGYKQMADGSLKEEITASIERDGLQRRFKTFSGGERCRLEMAMILALQAMINATNSYGGLHFLHIDEITEGIDPLGLKLLMKSLECFDFPILVTTHVMNVVYPEVLMVVKEFGISKIEKENYAND